MKRPLALLAAPAIQLLVVAVALCVLGPHAAWAEVAASGRSDSGGGKASRATPRLLREHGLKRLAGKEPAEAIRALAALRSQGVASTGAISSAIAEIALTAGRDAPPNLRAGFFLCAAAETYADALEEAMAGRGSAVAGGPPAALELHREAVEGLIESLQIAAAPVLDGRPQQIAGPLSRYELSWSSLGAMWTPATHDLIAAASLAVAKRQRIVQAGVGVPVVAVAKEEPLGEEELEGGVFEIYRSYFPLTAVLELGPAAEDTPRTAALRLLDPRLHDRYDLDGTDYPLAVDIGAQLHAMSQEIDTTFGKKGVLHAEKYLSLSGLYLLEPPSTGRIPVVMIHGLSSSPKTWAEAYESFQLDPELRQGYQFWFFAYPTGLPFTYSAMLLRRALVEAMDQLGQLGDDASDQRMVLLGHSMGGLLARMQVTDSGNALWEALFTRPPEEMGLATEDSELLQEMLVVEPLPFVERAVFCSTPHRGSKHAASALGKLGASLVKVPGELIQLGQRTVRVGVDALSPEAAERGKLPDSVQSLQPDFPVLQVLEELGIDPRIAYHSIVGDRGKGDTPDSSDGVVGYWSSHLEGAASERIVASGHSSHKHPDGVAELRRILHEHLAVESEPALEQPEPRLRSPQGGSGNPLEATPNGSAQEAADSPSVERLDAEQNEQAEPPDEIADVLPDALRDPILGKFIKRRFLIDKPGFSIETGGRVQVQYYDADSDDPENEDEVFLRRVRPYLIGHVGDNWTWKTELELSADIETGGIDFDQLDVRDFFVRYRGFSNPSTQLTLGNQKAPFSRDFLAPNTHLLLIERSAVGQANSGVPTRTLGVHFRSVTPDERLAYSLSLGYLGHETDVDRIRFKTLIFGSGNLNEGPNLAGRLEWQPRGAVTLSDSDNHSCELLYSVGVAGYVWDNDGRNNQFTEGGVALDPLRADMDSATGFEVSGGVRGRGITLDWQYNRIESETVVGDFTGGLYRDGDARLDVAAIEGAYWLAGRPIELGGSLSRVDSETYEDTWDTATGVINIHVREQFGMKLQIAHSWIMNREGIARDDFQETRIQVQYVW